MKIYLNVYDLAKANYYLHSVGFGIYHTGIQIGSSEYHFGGHEGSSTGVCTTEPKEFQSNVIYRETIFLGDCSMSQNQVNSIIEELKREYPGNSYDVLQRNCNHFSNAVCKKLLGKKIPGYVNRMAAMGQMFRCCLPASLLAGPDSDPTRQNQPVPAKNLSSSSSSSSFQFSAFKGKAVSIGGNSQVNNKKYHSRIPNDSDESAAKSLGYVRQQNDLEG